jgi:hypothetical protein
MKRRSFFQKLAFGVAGFFVSKQVVESQSKTPTTPATPVCTTGSVQQMGVWTLNPQWETAEYEWKGAQNAYEIPKHHFYYWNLKNK